MKTEALWEWLTAPVVSPDLNVQQLAEQRQIQLTKPPGALGRLEDIAVRLAALQRTEYPRIDRVHITVFAGDHGVAVEGVSAYPQQVTAEMVRNFARGGAAICVTARALGAELVVVNVGTAYETSGFDQVIHQVLGPGTANFIYDPAMSDEQCGRALEVGREAVERARGGGAQLFIGGEMGIGNTTSASAIACVLLARPPIDLVGPGTGLDTTGVARKTAVVQRALEQHQQHCRTPLGTLRRLGGFEIAALTGSYITCAQRGLPVLVDGFISTVAALLATRISPSAANWMLYSHTSAEPGHRLVLEALSAQPLLDIGMRLGEGCGAAVTVPLLRLACALHREMATFGEAGVSQASREVSCGG